MDSRWLAVLVVALTALTPAQVLAIRTYKYLELSNGIRVLIVSDPHASKSAASLDVGIGSWSDPEPIPGLAHFLEHMLFLGTKKYPVEGQYRRFLSKHGGLENAYTIYENTNFYFSATGGLSVFSEAIDRFAQFFIAPTLNASAGQREMQAVDSEFRKRINVDYLRFRQILMAAANPKHPYHRFTTGTIDTLNISSIHSKLVQFHKTYYSANLMTLVVLGKMSLHSIERLVRRSFSDVPNLNLERPSFNSPPAFPVPDFTGIKVLMEPLKVVNSVYMYWPLPSLDSKQRANPIYYIAWMVGHEGTGSVLSALKARQWATSVLAGPGLQTTSHWLMQISLTLTDAGLANINEVISIIFQYIRLIEREGVDERIYKEQHRLNLLNYLYQPKARPDVFVKTISRNMQVLQDPKDFRLPPTRSYYDPKLIRSILSLLTPQRLLLFVASPHYWQKHGGIPNPNNISKPNLDHVEKWYKTNYRKDKIPAGVMSAWETAPIGSELSIMGKNPFVPGRLHVLPLPTCTPLVKHYLFMSLTLQRELRRRDPSACRRYAGAQCGCSFRYPERLISGSGFDLWWKREMNYRTPKLYVTLLLGSTRLGSTVKEAAIAVLFRHILLSHLNDKIYPAKLAGFTLSVKTPVAGLQLSFFGYSDEKAYTHLIKTTLSGLKGYESHIANETWFSSSKTRTSESVAGFGATAQVFQHVRKVYENRIMQKTFYDRSELASAMLNLTSSELQEHMRSVFKKLYLAALVYGNANQPQARTYGRDIVKGLAEQGLKKLISRRSGVLHQQRLNVPPGSNIAFRVKGPNPSDVNSGVNVMYQIGPACGSKGTCNEEEYCKQENVNNFIMSRAVAYYMKASCFEQLRTKEQLGYIVFCYPYESNGVASVHFIVQSSKYEPQYLLQRVESFVQQFSSTLMTKVRSRLQWAHGIRLGALVSMSNGRNMKYRNSKYWQKLVDGSCKFDRHANSLKGMRALLPDRSNIMRFYKKFFLDKTTRKLMTVQLYGKGKAVSSVAAPGQTIVTKENIEQFKSNAEFYPPETN